MALARNEADHPSSPLVKFGPDAPLLLDSGGRLDRFQVAYQTYGELNRERSNAILVTHALTHPSADPDASTGAKKRLTT